MLQNASTVRETSRQAASTAFSSEPVEESACTDCSLQFQNYSARPEPVEGLRIRFFNKLLGDNKEVRRGERVTNVKCKGSGTNGWINHPWSGSGGGRQGSKPSIALRTRPVVLTS